MENICYNCKYFKLRNIFFGTGDCMLNFEHSYTYATEELEKATIKQIKIYDKLRTVIDGDCYAFEKRERI